MTKSGGPAVAIDDDTTLPNPRPAACGYLTTSEEPAQVQAAASHLPASTNPAYLYPVGTETYRAWQQRVAGAR